MKRRDFVKMLPLTALRPAGLSAQDATAQALNAEAGKAATASGGWKGAGLGEGGSDEPLRRPDPRERSEPSARFALRQHFDFFRADFSDGFRLSGWREECW
jgi:hypothetical protein